MKRLFLIFTAVAVASSSSAYASDVCIGVHTSGGACIGVNIHSK